MKTPTAPVRKISPAELDADEGGACAVCSRSCLAHPSGACRSCRRGKPAGWIAPGYSKRSRSAERAAMTTARKAIAAAAPRSPYADHPGGDLSRALPRRDDVRSAEEAERERLLKPGAVAGGVAEGARSSRTNDEAPVPAAVLMSHREQEAPSSSGADNPGASSPSSPRVAGRVSKVDDPTLLALVRSGKTRAEMEAATGFGHTWLERRLGRLIARGQITRKDIARSPMGSPRDEETNEQIRALLASGKTQAEVATAFGVSRGAIANRIGRMRRAGGPSLGERVRRLELIVAQLLKGGAA